MHQVKSCNQTYCYGSTLSYNLLYRILVGIHSLQGPALYRWLRSTARHCSAWIWGSVLTDTCEEVLSDRVELAVLSSD